MRSHSNKNRQDHPHGNYGALGWIARRLDLAFASNACKKCDDIQCSRPDPSPDPFFDEPGCGIDSKSPCFQPFPVKSAAT
jgi:hypothetical protein